MSGDWIRRRGRQAVESVAAETPGRGRTSPRTHGVQSSTGGLAGLEDSPAWWVGAPALLALGNVRLAAPVHFSLIEARDGPVTERDQAEPSSRAEPQPRLVSDPTKPADAI